MNINKTLVLVLFLITLLTITVSSQISQVSNTISVEEKQDCTIIYYNQTEKVYGDVIRTRPIYGTCFNAANQSYHTCINGTETYQNYEIIGNQTVLRNNTNCITKSYIVSVTKDFISEKKKIDFSNWGVCVNSTENGCLAITCGTLKGGSARNGIFNGCDGGKACQKFLFCGDSIKVLFKASRQDFVEEDPTFYLSKLDYKEVG